ncbi:hypothetical protein [Natronoglycomyces albus]|uniref:Uncharacterized protein n=1 Tax=Natronoglycomyces albus TaxID=2811108 RepID=A0A895XJI0_9ACTN|nr:hypothetical protein [Natronoglycomyces albus]QSB05921.1 hypothetical protein JQS30_03065 [Natronoglycomyces albus]
MPASILLAVLAATGLLLLAPALVRRYDADERLMADRANSGARLLERTPSTSNMPRQGPINPPTPATRNAVGRSTVPAATHAELAEDAGRSDEGSSLSWPPSPWDDQRPTFSDSFEYETAQEAFRPTEGGGDSLVAQADAPTHHELDKRNRLNDAASTGRPRGWERRGCRSGQSVRLETDQPATAEDHTDMRNQARLRAQRAQWWRARHRKVLYVLLALLFIELIGVIIVGPGFWVGVVVSAILLGCYVALLRAKVLARQRSRAAHPSRGLSSQRPTYVPAQETAHDLDEAQAHSEIDDHAASPEDLADETELPEGEYEDEYDEPEPQVRQLRPTGSLLFGDDGETDSVSAPPDRRHSGAIRGRSYESPASGH